MIYGIGVDLVSSRRMGLILRKYGNRFASRILSDKEFAEWQHRVENIQSIEAKASKLAKYWAAKEAVSKAFGTGFAQGLSWRDIGLEYGHMGKPMLYFQGVAEQWMNSNNIAYTHISFSDEKEMVIAMVILEMANTNQ